MIYQMPPDVEALVQEQMTLNDYASPDDVLRAALQVLRHFGPAPIDAEQEYRQAVAAVRQGVADVEAGRVRPLREVLADARSHLTNASE